MKNQKGFTLVELLVVIAIIGILSTVAVVNLNSARDKAITAAAKAWGSGLAPGVVLCENEGGTITSPMISGAYNPGALTIADTNFCREGTASGYSDTGTDWPTDLPQGYSEVLVTDNTTGDGIWDIRLSGSGVTTVNCDENTCTES